jgi:hypothetical protein
METSDMPGSGISLAIVRYSDGLRIALARALIKTIER